MQAASQSDTMVRRGDVEIPLEADERNEEEDAAGPLTPRSRIADINKSYNAPSTILRPKTVDFEASVMKLSDNDERLK